MISELINATIEFDEERLPDVEKKLNEIGYVRIQFKEKDLPANGKNFVKLAEHFFINFLKKIGGQFFEHD